MAKFIIVKDINGAYRWKLVSIHGEVMAASERYTSKQSAMSAAALIKSILGSAEIVDTIQRGAQKHLFTIFQRA
jgi:uncharacterized protein